MSTVTFIKDYFEIALNDFLSVDTGNTTPVQEIIFHLASYLWQNSGRFLYYLISFEWFRYNVFLPVQIPTNIASNIGLLQEDLHIKFLQIASGNNNLFFIFFVGFFNSFFLSLPFSCSHFISFRRLMIQGIPAGIYAGFGTVFGQFLFLLSFFSGLRFLLISWLTFEPYNYFLGISLICSIVFDMVHQRSLLSIKASEKQTLIKIFFLNFFLAWVEQSCFNEFLSNITLMKQPSIFETLAGQTAFQFHLVQLSYVLGILVGSIFFTCFFGWFFYSLFYYCVELFGASQYRWIPRLNRCLVVLILGITLSSYCDRGADYLLTAPIGFISEDKALKKTPFYPFDYNVINPILVDSYKVGKKWIKNIPLDHDIATFDKGFYLRPATGWKLAFENLNFRAENLWLNKRDYDANSWMERFKKSRSQETLHKTVKYLFDKAKGKKVGPQKHEVLYTPETEKKELQFLPPDTFDSSVINELFFKKKFEEKSLTKSKKLQTRNFEDFIQTLSPEYFQKKETNFSLLELHSNEQDTLLQSLDIILKSLPEDIKSSTAYLADVEDLKKLLKKDDYESPAKLVMGKHKKNESDLNNIDSAFDDPLFEEQDEYDYSFNGSNSKEEIRFFDNALLYFSQRVEDMFLFGMRPFQEYFFSPSKIPMRENIYKQFYYSNFIYKLFLHIDVDDFLNRQPKKYQLTPNQENFLFQKRQVLQNYHESLYQYTTLLDNPKNVRNLLKLNDIASLIQKQLNFYSVASESYSNRVYNQQFKGTLNVVRRLFAITPDSQFRSLKYDQPLFSDQNENENLHFFHEDLLDKEFQNENKFLKTNPLQEINPYLEKTTPIPLYSGWDSELRQFVITTRFQSRTSTGVQINLPTEQEMKMYSTLSQILPTETFLNTKKNETIRLLSFTQWPLTKEFLDFPKSKVDIKYETLFESKFDPIYNTPKSRDAFGFFPETKEGEDKEPWPWEYTLVPPNVTEGARRKSPYSYYNRVPAPRGGGFIWPGYHFIPKTVKETLHTFSFQNLTQNFRQNLEQNLNLKKFFTKKRTE